MAESDGLICAFQVGARGTARTLDWPAVEKPGAAKGWRWIHLSTESPQAAGWLREHSGIDRHLAETLLSPETRPRCEQVGDGLLLILRGVNLNPGSEPEDMVSIRMWIEGNRVISTRRRRLLAVQALREKYEGGRGPATIGDFLIALANGLLDRMAPVIAELDDEADALEEASGERHASETRANMLGLRRRAILLRRYLAPQREALTQLAAARTPFFDDFQRGPLRSVSDRVIRYVEDLDAIRERAAAIQDEVSTQLAEQMNTAMYRLSIVATVFLPLSLFTGLLGINVAGIPGAGTAWAFWAVCVILGVMVLATLWMLKWLGRSPRQ